MSIKSQAYKSWKFNKSTSRLFYALLYTIYKIGQTEIAVWMASSMEIDKDHTSKVYLVGYFVRVHRGFTAVVIAWQVTKELIMKSFR